jgi:hypothetical protein
MVNVTAMAPLNRQGSEGITVVSSQRTSLLVSQIISMFIPVTDRMLQTGSKGLPNSQISPICLESLHYLRLCIGFQFMECDMKPQASAVT